MSRRNSCGWPNVLPRLFIVLIGCLASALVGVHAAPTSVAGANESRVVLDEDILWATSRKETDRILERLKRAGLNVYVPCVWHGRGTYYPSPVAAIDRMLTGRIANGDDPLAYLIQRAHELGIQVHPWFTVVRREGGFYPQWRAEGTHEDAFDVHNPAFREFVVKLMLDVVRRYPVDGINLDYIRSMGICQSKTCKDQYKASTGRNLDQDVLLRHLPLHPGSDSLAKWNADAVASIVRDVSTAAKALRAGVIVSVDAHPLHPDLILQGQDSIDWANRGWVDVIFNMDYAQAANVDLMGRIRNEVKDVRQVVLLTSFFDIQGGRVVPRPPDMVAGYVALSRQLWPGSGIAFYHFKQLTDGQIDALRAGPFALEAQPLWHGASH